MSYLNTLVSNPVYTVNTTNSVTIYSSSPITTTGMPSGGGGVKGMFM